MLALRGRQPLDRIAQHRPRHLVRVLLEEQLESTLISFADLAEHPTDGLVNQVLFVVEQSLGDANRVVEFADANEVLCRDDRDASLPQILRSRESVE